MSDFVMLDPVALMTDPNEMESWERWFQQKASGLRPQADNPPSNLQAKVANILRTKMRRSGARLMLMPTPDPRYIPVGKGGAASRKQFKDLGIIFERQDGKEIVHLSGGTWKTPAQIREATPELWHLAEEAVRHKSRKVPKEGAAILKGVQSLRKAQLATLQNEAAEWRAQQEAAIHSRLNKENLLHPRRRNEHYAEVARRRGRRLFAALDRAFEEKWGNRLAAAEARVNHPERHKPRASEIAQYENFLETQKKFAEDTARKKPSVRLKARQGKAPWKSKPATRHTFERKVYQQLIDWMGGESGPGGGSRPQVLYRNLVNVSHPTEVLMQLNILEEAFNTGKAPRPTIRGGDRLVRLSEIAPEVRNSWGDGVMPRYRAALGAVGRAGASVPEGGNIDRILGMSGKKRHMVRARGNIAPAFRIAREAVDIVDPTFGVKQDTLWKIGHAVGQKDYNEATDLAIQLERETGVRERKLIPSILKREEWAKNRTASDTRRPYTRATQGVFPWVGSRSQLGQSSPDLTGLPSREQMMQYLASRTAKKALPPKPPSLKGGGNPLSILIALGLTGLSALRENKPS